MQKGFLNAILQLSDLKKQYRSLFPKSKDKKRSQDAHEDNARNKEKFETIECNFIDNLGFLN